MATDGLLRRVAKFELYAVLAGLGLALVYAYFLLFKISIPLLPRILLLFCCPVYYPLLLAVNAALYCVLYSARGNLRACERALGSVMGAITAPVLLALPAGRVGLDDLRARLLRSGEHVKETEADARAASSRGPLGVASRVLLDAAVRTVLYALEARYADVFHGKGREISRETVKSALTGEVVGLLVSPFTATLQGYTILVAGEAVGLVLLPFVLTWLFGGRAAAAVGNSK